MMSKTFTVRLADTRNGVRPHQKDGLIMDSTINAKLEWLPGDVALDETDINLRAYLAGLSDDHLASYEAGWNDEQVIAWDGNFRSDGALMLVCCERDVDVHEFRQVLARHMTARRDVLDR
jgi:hypothetical protein